MQEDENPWQQDEDCPGKTFEKNNTCQVCGVTFHHPILATVHSRGQTQKYQACPRCMTKIRITTTPKERPENTRGKTSPSETAKPNITSGETTCEHFFGFLNKHTKNTLFPEECLTCPKMVECLLKPPTDSTSPS
jgi:hypothetical protein